MSTQFQINDPSIESQWRAIILFGKNSATYKFAFAKCLLEVIERQKNRILVSDLAIPFSDAIIQHLKRGYKQGNSPSSEFLKSCQNYLDNQISKEHLYEIAEKYAFKYVIDAFQNVNGKSIPDKFYEKNFGNGRKELIITDNLLKIKELFQYQNFEKEVEARWNLVETAWNLKINPALLEMHYDPERSLFFVKNNLLRRVDVSAVRDSLNGYQKGRCFYSFQNISIRSSDKNLCEVDHFLPHVNKQAHLEQKVNIDGVWNLVLAESSINREKKAKIPEKHFLERLYNRNEFFIQSKHPLAETIINQTGQTQDLRRKFLELQYNLALTKSIQKWRPSIELNCTF